jgi:hypothetical protein
MPGRFFLPEWFSMEKSSLLFSLYNQGSHLATCKQWIHRQSWQLHLSFVAGNLGRLFICEPLKDFEEFGSSAAGPSGDFWEYDPGCGPSKDCKFFLISSEFISF